MRPRRMSDIELLTLCALAFVPVALGQSVIPPSLEAPEDARACIVYLAPDAVVQQARPVTLDVSISGTIGRVTSVQIAEESSIGVLAAELPNRWSGTIELDLRRAAPGSRWCFR